FSRDWSSDVCSSDLSHGVSSTLCILPTNCSQPHRHWLHALPRVRPLHIASPKKPCTKSGAWELTRQLRPRRRHRRSACRPATSAAHTKLLSPSKNLFSRAIDERHHLARLAFL